MDAKVFLPDYFFMCLLAAKYFTLKRNTIIDGMNCNNFIQYVHSLPCDVSHVCKCGFMSFICRYEAKTIRCMNHYQQLTMYSYT